MLLRFAAALVAGGSFVLAACGGEDTDAGSANPYLTKKAPKATVEVEMIEFAMKPNVPSAPAGPIRFRATNASKSMVHELAVLRVKEDGSFDNTGEVEDVDPGKSGEITLDLPAGKYVLACVLVPGEAGSTYDHFKEGMKTEFEIR
ncbi:MAG: cupredoxin domain-containing protein [Dehalococcoidia bacterium]